MFKMMRKYLLLWSTQALSQLGSSMTSFALTIWVYEKTGSALQSSLLMICSYAPYVLVSIFAGALSDKWNKKKTMLICDFIAAIMTFSVLTLLITEMLKPWHIYLINVVTGLMNTVQQPASEIMTSLVTPKDCYQKASGLNSLSRSLISILSPIIATSIYSFFGINIVCVFDLTTFFAAFITLLFFINIREVKIESENTKVFELVKEGFEYLKDNRLILDIILFLSGINFCASSCEAILTPMVLSKTGNNETILGIVTSCSGVAMFIGSFIATGMREPKNKAKTIYVTIFASMLFENFMLALSNNYIIWCLGQIVGWMLIPIFSACYDITFRNNVPIEMQGRVYSARNSLQFFAIPLAYLVSGILIDNVFEPYMEVNKIELLNKLFGYGKGSGAAIAMFITGIIGILWCIPFKNKLDDSKLKKQ